MQKIPIKKDCKPNKWTNNPKHHDKFECDEKKGRWLLKEGHETQCPINSIHANDDEHYMCNLITGRWKLKKQFKWQPKKDAPIRPLLPYFLWLKDNRAHYAKIYSDLKSYEFPRMMGKIWHELPIDIKEYYTEMFDQLTDQYKQDVIEFKNNHLDDSTLRTFIPRQLPPSRKGQKTYYNVWFTERFNSMKGIIGISRTEILEQLKQEWRNFTNQQKKDIKNKIINKIQPIIHIKPHVGPRIIRFKTLEQKQEDIRKKQQQRPQ